MIEVISFRLQSRLGRKRGNSIGSSSAVTLGPTLSKSLPWHMVPPMRILRAANEAGRRDEPLVIEKGLEAKSTSFGRHVFLDNSAIYSPSLPSKRPFLHRVARNKRAMIRTKLLSTSMATVGTVTYHDS